MEVTHPLNTLAGATLPGHWSLKWTEVSRTLGRVKLVGTDIDGTILPKSGIVSERTKAALAALGEAGVPLVLVTARPPRWVDRVAQQLGVTGTAVCANGAVDYDLASGSVIDAITVPAATLLEMASLLREAIPGVHLAVETTSGIAMEPGFPTRENNLTAREVAPFEHLEAVHDNSTIKILAVSLGGNADAMLAAAKPLVGHLLEPSHSSAEVPLLELAPAGVTKAEGLARMAARFGVAAADVIAFGDAPNDLPMLRWAGTSYAVANAHPEVLAAADHVIASVDDDGVAQVIEARLARG